METLKSWAASPVAKEAAFLFAVLLLLGGFKFSLEAAVEK